MLSTSTPNTRSAVSRAVPVTGRIAGRCPGFRQIRTSSGLRTLVRRDAIAWIPTPRRTSKEAGLPYSPCLTSCKDCQLTRLSLATRSQLAACATTSTGAADQLESVVSSVWRRHRRMDQEHCGCLRSKGLTMLQALQPAILCANMHGHLLAPMQASAGERVGAQWASSAKGATHQENCSSILPVRRRTGPTTIFTS